MRKDRLTAEGFEKNVAMFVQKLGSNLPKFSVTRLEKLRSAEGTFEIDVVARMEALGSSLTFLIECKKHRSAIKRDVVQVLYDRIRALGAHKGLLFSTASFQSGAVEYAKAHGIALVQLTEKGAVYIAKPWSIRAPRAPSGAALTTAA